MSDLIDRQALLKQIDIDSDGEPGYYGDTWKFIDTIKSMPPATQLSTNLAEVGTDAVSREAVKELAYSQIRSMYCGAALKEQRETMLRIADNVIGLLAPVATKQPEIVRCKDCKHWKDSDGVFRRGTGAESKCPLNLHQVYEGTFFCGLAERREVQDENDKTTNNTTNA